jgi:putative FmdB family regulatory protein
MPLYEYRCTSCGERTEALQHLGASPLTVCSRCGGALAKMFSAPALQFKGSGFYVNDYGRGSAGKQSNETAKASETSSASKPAETSTKPAAAPAKAD